MIRLSWPITIHLKRTSGSTVSAPPRSGRYGPVPNPKLIRLCLVHPRGGNSKPERSRRGAVAAPAPAPEVVARRRPARCSPGWPRAGPRTSAPRWRRRGGRSRRGSGDLELLPSSAILGGYEIRKGISRSLVRFLKSWMPLVCVEILPSNPIPSSRTHEPSIACNLSPLFALSSR
jgi:hypothetical protein